MSHARVKPNGPELNVSSLILGMVQFSAFLGYGLIFSTSDVANVGSMRVKVPVLGSRIHEPLIEQRS